MIADEEYPNDINNLSLPDEAQGKVYDRSTEDDDFPVGSTVETLVDINETRSAGLASGSVGVVLEMEDEYIVVGFAKPFRDSDGTIWLFDQFNPDRNWIRIRYKPEELRFIG